MCASLDQDNVPNFFIDGDSVKVDEKMDGRGPLISISEQEFTCLF